MEEVYDGGGGSPSQDTLNSYDDLSAAQSSDSEDNLQSNKYLCTRDPIALKRKRHGRDRPMARSWKVSWGNIHKSTKIFSHWNNAGLAEDLSSEGSRRFRTDGRPTGVPHWERTGKVDE